MAEGIGGIKITIEAEDNASGKLKEVSEAVGELGSGATEGKKEVKALSDEMKTSGKAAKSYGDDVAKTSGKVKENTRSVSDSERAYSKQKKQLEQNNKSLGEYAGGLQKSRKEQTGLSKTINAAAEKTDRNNKKLIESEKAYNKVTKAAKGAARETKMLGDGNGRNPLRVDSLVTEALNAEKEASRLRQAEQLIEKGGKYQTLGKSVDDITKPLQIASIAVGAAGVMAVKSAMDYETAFTGVKKTVDGTPEQLEEINVQLKEMALSTPVSAAGLADIAAAGGQLGVATPNIVKFTKTMADMSVATNLGGDEGAAVLAKFINVSGEDMNNIDRVGSSIVALGNNTATTEADIAEMALRMAKFGNTVGMNSNQVLGYSAALSSMGVEAQAGGSALGRVWMDIQKAVSGGGKDLKEYAKMAGMSASEFKKAWGTDSSGAFNSMIKGLSQSKDLIGSLEKLGIKNTLDVTSVLALANNYELLEKCLKLSSTAYEENTALSNEANTAYKTTANQVQLAKNAVTDAAMSLGEQMLPAVTKGANKVSSLANGFGNLSDGAKKAIITTGGVVVGLGATTKAAASTIETIGTITKGVGEIKKLGIAKGAASIASALTPVGLTTLAVAAAVGVSAAAYKKYKDAQINWGKSLEEANQKLTASVGKVNSLRQVQGRLEKLKLVINSEKSSKDEVAAAKEELKQIAEYLNKEYSLNITVNDDGLGDTVDKIEKITNDELKQQLPQMRAAAGAALIGLTNTKEQHNNYPQEASKRLKQIESESDKIGRLGDAYSKIAAIKEDYYKEQETYKQQHGKDMSIDNETKFLETQKKYVDEVKKILQETGVSDYGMLNGDDFDISGWLKNAEKDSKKLTDLISNLKSELDGLEASEGNYQKLLKEVTSYGKNEYKNGNRAEGISKLKQAVDEFGASASETARDTVLLSNGFDSLGDMKGKPQEQIQKLEQEANNLLHNFEGYKDKTIHFNVEADTTTITDVEGKITEFENKDVSIKIGADGDLTVLNEATGKVEMLQGLGAVSLQLNADNDWEALDAFGKKVAEIDGETYEVTVTVNEEKGEVVEPEPKEGEVIYRENFDQIGKTGPDLKGTVYYKAAFETSPNAKGTRNFGGGFAMVNDERGTDDPRELIVDRGRAFIPEGKDVILPLSRGAKIYTASQTKRIMSGLGVKRYAKGKDNDDIFTVDGSMPNTSRSEDFPNVSTQGATKWEEASGVVCGDGKGTVKAKTSGDKISDEFKAAQEAWQHIVNSRAVSVTEDLEKWVEFSEQFKTNAKDIEAIEEGIYTRTLAVRNELNEISKEYISDRTALGDWETFGDSPTAAFNRIREREAEYVSKGVILEKDAKKQLAEIGKQMYDDRISQSENWLDHETKYNKMSVDEYIDGLNRMMKYTEEAYASGMLTVREYYEAAASLRDKTADKQAEKQDELYENWANDRDSYLKQRQAYNDWDDFGDSEYKFWQRVIEREKEFFKADGDWDKHYGNIIDAQISMYNANADVYDKMLSEQSEYIDSVSDYYDKLIEKKQTAYEERNLYADLEEAEQTRKIYSGAVTQKGKDTYKDALKQIDELNNEIEIARLTKKQTQEVEALRADYEKAELKKDKVLADVKNIGYDMQRIVDSIQRSGSDVLMPILNDILRAVKLGTGGSTVYGPTTLNINAGGAGIGGLTERYVRAIQNGYNK